MAKQSNSPVEIDLDNIINKARANFSRNEKGLGAQISTGSDIFRPTEDRHFVCWKESPWEMLVGIKGIPFGRIVQIAGRPDSGKSTHAMAFMKQAQDQGVIVILWDSESKFSANRFDNYFGGDSKKLLIVSSKLIAEGADMVNYLIDSTLSQYPDRKVLVVWDSVGGTLAKSEGDKDLRSSKQMAEASKENGQVLRSFIHLMEKFKDKVSNEEKIAVLLINQTYANIGAPGQKESGGQKVEYFSSIIVQLTRKSDLFRVKNKIKRKIGIVTRARVRKNHLFDGEDSIAELDLDITAGGIMIHKKSPLLESLKAGEGSGSSGDWE
jgi:RecA/RadA recombinase